MSNYEQYRAEGRYVTAIDVADRLMPDLNINEVLLWPPDLFAYTSFIMALTSAYQLVVSPPSGKTWQPSWNEICEWLCDNAEENLRYWLNDVKNEWKCEGDYQAEEKVNDAIKELKDLNPIKLSDLLFEIRTENFSEAIVSFLKNSESDPGRSIDHPWELLVEVVGNQWRKQLDTLGKKDCDIIDDTELVGEESLTDEVVDKIRTERGKKLLKIVLEHTPPVVLGCWAFFYHQVTDKIFHNESTIHISDLLCNQDHIQRDKDYCEKLWKISQALLTMHAISDIASLGFGLVDDPKGKRSLEFAEKLLFGRKKGLKKETVFWAGGSLSTFHSERCRVLPKRHNPSVGITLRSISSNLAFHQSAVDVVWRKTRHNSLGERLIQTKMHGPPQTSTFAKKQTLSLLLMPFPLSVKTTDFDRDDLCKDKIVMSNDHHGFFSYNPNSKLDLGPKEKTERQKEKAEKLEAERAFALIEKVKNEQPDASEVDIVVFPEASLSLDQFKHLKTQLEGKYTDHPSIIIAGVRESKEDVANEHEIPLENVNFPRNAVYCKYYDKEQKSYYHRDGKKTGRTPKYKQYKHHRWQLNRSQIRSYGLSSVLGTSDMTWWENIKIPKRRVSFLNVGDRVTISHLICEDLARQDPIAELIRHVGPSLVVAILMDGPQLKNRWSARYATVMADDPGCSVITLTSIGMVRRHISEFGLMSRVIGLWNESGSSHSREIELAQGAEAVLLTLEIDEKHEKTADGRQETVPTSIIRLVDVTQIYPD